MRFSVKNRAAENYVSQFVHASVPVGCEEYGRHLKFLMICSIASGSGLAIVPLLIVGRQGEPNLWAMIAAAAAVPFFMGIVASRSGKLDTVLKFVTIIVATLFGCMIAVAGWSSAPVVVCAAFACVEPVIWRMRRPGLRASIMAGIMIATAFGWAFASALMVNTSTAGLMPDAVLWAAAILYAASSIYRIARAKARTELALILDRERYDLISANSTDLVTAHNRNGTTTFVAPSCSVVLGTKPAELTGIGFVGKIHLQDRIAFLKAVSDVWHSRSVQKLKFRMRCKGNNGRAWIWMEAELRPRFSENGAVVSVVSICRDITLSVERDVEHEIECKRHKQSDAAQKRFLATMSHELRTPLNAIIGFADVLQQELIGKLEQKRHREYVSHIHSSGQHLLQVVNDLLDMSRIDAGRYELKFSEFSLAELIDATLGMMQPLAENAGVAIIRDTDESLSVIRGDRRCWQQVLINLLSNAIKFTPDGGSVRLTTRQFGRNVKILIRDTGIGIDPEFIKSIGEPFMQADNGSDRQFEGTGLGLSVVKGLVSLHGGDFEIKSTMGKGTVATVILPMQPVVIRPVPHTEEIQVVGLTATIDDEQTSVTSKGDNHARLSA